MNVSEYILKPINAAELTAVLEKLKSQLDAERAERQNLERLRQRYDESLPLLRGLFLSRLLDGRIPSDEVSARAERYDIDLDGSAWVAALSHQEDAGERRELLTLSIQQLFDENLHLEGCTCTTFLYNDDLALVAAFQGKADAYGLIAELDRICKLVRSYLGLDLTVGVGEPCASLGELSQSAAGAHNALDYRILVGAGRAIYIGDLEPDAAARLSFDEGDERELAEAVKLGGEADIRSAVERLVEKLRTAGLALSQCHLFFLELLTCLLKLTRGADLELEAVFGPGFNGAVQITDFRSPEQVGDWCLARCLRIRELIGRQRTDSAWRTVEKAKAFIAAHYAESDLSVESLCAYLHLSPAYFSTLFKRETGMSFIAYVTVVRMEAAAEALRNSEEKTYLIAQRTGYADPNYFSYVFKKHFGVSPTKYRAG